jgi:Mor family transcriptional regulator
MEPWMTDELFWASVDMSAGATGCWPWTKYFEPETGYGRITRMIDGMSRRLMAHRYAWAQLNGLALPPDDVIVRHRCDNRLCCNAPKCLLIGSHLDNMADCVERGRRRGGRRNGEVHPRSKLTDTQVAEMRTDRWEHRMKVLDLAAKYGVSKAQVSKVTRGVSRGKETDPSTVVLTNEAIADIRAARKRGETLTVIATRHRISVVHVSHVVNRRGYN